MRAEDTSDVKGWWSEDDEKQRVDSIVTDIERIERAQEYRRLNDLMHASLYGNVEQFGFTPKSYGSRVPRAHARLALNVVRNVVATVVSKIAAKNKVHPKFLTNGGEASVQRKAKGMEKIASGIFYNSRFYKTQRRVFRDVSVMGTGFVRPWADELTRTVTIERVAPWNILVDDEDAIDGDPSTLFHRRWYDRRKLARLYPGKEEIIRNAGKRIAQGQLSNQEGESDSTTDVIAVYEAFRLPSRPGAKDGTRMVVVDSGELGRAKWEHDYHPYPKMVWSEELEGFFGAGVAYELAGIQDAINGLLLEFERSHLLIKGGWMVEHNAKVVLKHINDDLGKIIRYTGIAPQYIQPVAIPEDTYRYLWDLYAKAFEVCGVSQLSASSQKPAGLNSGEAQRVYLDNESERFLDVGTNLEEFTRDVVEQSLDRARELAEDKEGGGFVVRTSHDGAMEKVDMKDVDLPKNDYLVEVFPTSYLPRTPAGRLAFINDLIEMGLVSDEGEAMKLLGFPDFEAFMNRKNAPRELLDRNIESIVEEGTWRSPEPLDDHELALIEVPMAIAQARNKGVSKERLSLLRRYVVLSTRLQMLKQQGGIEGAVTASDPQADPNAQQQQQPPPDAGAPPPAGPPPEQMGIAA